MRDIKRDGLAPMILRAPIEAIRPYVARGVLIEQHGRYYMQGGTQGLYKAPALSRLERGLVTLVRLYDRPDRCFIIEPS